MSEGWKNRDEGRGTRGGGRGAGDDGSPERTTFVARAFKSRVFRSVSSSVLPGEAIPHSADVFAQYVELVRECERRAHIVHRLLDIVEPLENFLGALRCRV